VFLAFVAVVLACGGGDNDNASGDDPQAILNSSVAAVGNVDSFHFRLDHENGSTPMPLSLDLTSAEGDIVVPDRLKAELRAKAVALNIRLDVIAIGNDTWITNPFSRRWERLPGAALTDIANPAALVSTLVEGLQDVQLALQGSMDSAALAEALPIAQPGYSPAVDLYIGQSDSLPRRARISGPLSSGEADNIVRQVDFSRFNEPVTIQAP
jgi:hypothetical protein